jgi:hypothetical protein
MIKVCEWTVNLWLEDLEVVIRFPAGASEFSLLQKLQTGCRTHQALHSMGTIGNFPWNKTARVSDKDTRPANADVKNEWSFNSTTSHAFMAWTEATLRLEIDVTKDEYF